jgi:ankyrin repeat protein
VDFAYPIDTAAEHGQLKIVKYLNNNNQKYTDDSLIWASRNGHLEIVEWIFENINTNNFNVKDAIKWASTEKHYEIVDFMERIIGKNLLTTKL